MMRAEMKVGLIVGLVAIAAAGIWWFSRPTNELDELPFDRPAMDATATGDTTLASDAIPVALDARSAGPSEPAPAPDRPATRELPAPGEPTATLAPAEEPSERPSREPLTEPPAGRTVVGEAERATTSEGATAERARPSDAPPPDVLAPRRRASLVEPAAPARKTYTIQPGDRLIDLAQEEYGDGRLWKAIKAVNPGIDENRLRVGQKVEIPSRAEAVRLTQPEARVGEATAAGPPRERAGVRRGAAGRATYVVGHGDSLIKIARNVLNDETRWEEIYELNRDKLESPNLIHPGMELRLPPLEKKTSPEDNARG